LHTNIELFFYFSYFIEIIICNFLKDSIKWVNLSRCRFFKLQMIYSYYIKVSLHFFKRIIILLKVNLLIYKLKCFLYEIILKFVNSCIWIFFHFILLLHNILDSPAHILQYINMINHCFLNFFHSFLVNFISVIQILSCSHMNILVFLNYLNPGYL
jgi:hypothetical protein